MSALLESYVAGGWFAADDEGQPLLDAATGEEVARVSATGVDLGAMTDHARVVGGPAIRALTFHERAGLLKAVAKRLTEVKDELYALSYRTGATKRDSMVDIDGGIGTVFSIASKGTRELPNDTVYLDGGLERLGREGTFLGQHVYTSRPGVAVQINAFNFPVWGMLEKLAPAFLAGLPTIVKPASQTAYLTELVVRRILEAGLLPDGALQLLCGSPAGLLEELRAQDSVAFTGSAHTGAHLRQHPSVLHGGVQLGVEADSLNCSVLGPDVTSSDPEFDLFVKGVVTEMTVKAGQKCTAIRRVIVPAAIAGEVTEAITARLAKVTVGNPADDSVRMGALVAWPARRGPQGCAGTARIGRGRLRRPRPGRPPRRRRRGARRLHVAAAAARLRQTVHRSGLRQLVSGCLQRGRLAEAMHVAWRAQSGGDTRGGSRRDHDATDGVVRLVPSREAERYTMHADRKRAAATLGKLITATDSGSPLTPVSQNDEKTPEKTRR